MMSPDFLHEGRHDPWPYVNYLLSILKVAYKEFEERVGRTKSPRGAKTEIVEHALRGMTKPFGIAEIGQFCPNVSREMIRRVMNSWRKHGPAGDSGTWPGRPLASNCRGIR